MFRTIRESGPKIRASFRLAIYLQAVLVYLAFLWISYTNITADELTQANNSMLSEANYLCLQLQSLDERSAAFQRIIETSGRTTAELAGSDPVAYRLLADPVGDVLSGYTLAETGTVAILSGKTVIVSDDERVPAGSDIQELIGEEAFAAIEPSISENRLQQVALGGAFPDDEDGYLVAARQGAYTVVIIEPSSMVFRDRDATVARETTAAVLMVLVALVIVDILLSQLVARRIDKTNEALARITSGELDVAVEERGFREFRTLARGINVTVDALKGWIAEAESRIDAELATAKTIQESQLPRDLPSSLDGNRFDIYASMDPAREIGGDFYDYFPVGEGSSPDEGKLAFIIADVSSKGIPAALFMMKAKALLREFVVGTMDLGAAVSEANHVLCDGNNTNMFVTAWIGVLDYASGHIEYVNAGHNPPLLHHEGAWTWMDKRSGPMLGLFDVSYRVHTIDCAPGDTLLLYTDGVTEAFDVDERLYGEDRLLAFVEAQEGDGARDLAVRELAKALRTDVAAHATGAEQSDDITILALKMM